MAKIIRTAATEPFVEMPDDDMINLPLRGDNERRDTPRSI